MNFKGLIIDMMFRGATMDEIRDAVECCDDVIKGADALEKLKTYREKYKPYPSEEGVLNEH